MKLIPLTKGMFAEVDDEDFYWLQLWKWQAEPYGKPGNYRAGTKAKDGRTIRMHRIIMGAPRGQRVDHKDQNPLNNQRSNLRFCTAAQNGSNVKKSNYRPMSSKYKGACLVRRKHWVLSKPWFSYIKVNQKQIKLGYFATDEEAARAYDAAAIKYHGEFACTNFPRVILCNTPQEKTA